MSVLWIVGTLAAVVLVLWVLLTITRGEVVRITGKPTPEEAKIEAQSLERAADIVNEGEKAKAEVLNADRDGLLDRLRDRVRGK